MKLMIIVGARPQFINSAPIIHEALKHTEMEEIGLSNVKGLVLPDHSKEEILTYLKLLMEQKKLDILSDDAELIAQINEQQYEYLQPKIARERVYLKFWHPPRRHDDQLFALSLACYASKEIEPTLIMVSR